jgi:hypothetical protein
VIGEIEQLLTALNAEGLRYLIVGGVAVVLHGYARATFNLDLIINLEPSNIARALGVFASRGFKPRPPVPMEAFVDPAERQRWIDEKNLLVFSLWHPNIRAFEVDIFVKEPFSFEDAYHRASRLSIGGSAVTVASIDDLIALKREAGRAQDAEDIEVLLELKKPHTDEVRDAPYDGSFDGTRRRQALQGRRIPPIDRLRTLERRTDELRRLLGRAS